MTLEAKTLKQNNEAAHKSGKLLKEKEKPGIRFNEILDHAGIKKGHGRILTFHQFLIKNLRDELGDISYSTTQSWFNQAAPPMSKINPIIDKLDEFIQFNADITKIKLWWKMGGESPFSPNEFDKDKLAKIEIEANYYLRQCCGADFDNYDINQLTAIVEKTLQFAKDFANPDIVDAPKDMLKYIVVREMGNLKE